MTFASRCVAGLAGLTLTLGLQAAPVELSGIKVADPVEVQGTKLQLNGAGIRYKAIFKVTCSPRRWPPVCPSTGAI